MTNLSVKYSFSDNFYKSLINLTEGFISPKEIDLIVSTFDTEATKFYFTKNSEANLLRILNSLYDRVSFLKDCLKYPHYEEILIAICASSNYLTDIVVRNPEYLYEIFNSQYLKQKISFDKLNAQVEKGLQNFKTFKSKLNFLKNTKRRFILKIALADLLHYSDLNTTTYELSIVAKIIISNLFNLCYTEILTKNEITKLQRRYCLFSLGKLGGKELNYSSDIDLILFFDKNLKVKKVDKEYFEILEEATHLFIKSSGELTDRGYLYRTDFRLRPDGKFSPLSRSIKDLILYYETKGEHWERQMLIKSDFIAGDEDLFKKFQDFLNSFIFSQINLSILKEIKKMKNTIEQKSSKYNIKICPGGIRDIEFSVQALQLLNGKRNRELRTGNTIEAIKLLNKFKLLSDEETEVLLPAYNLFRKIEHFLQMSEDKQTHTIPENSEVQFKLANYLGFSSSAELLNKIDQYQKSVREIFNSIVNGPLQNNLEKEFNLNLIKATDKGKIIKLLKFLESGSGPINQKRFDSRTIQLFSNIEPLLIKYLMKSHNPDKVIENFAKIIERTQIPYLFYKEFRNEIFFNDFLIICEFAQRAIDLWITDKFLDEVFLSRRIFISKLENHFNEFTFSQLKFILSVQFALKLRSRESVSLMLTKYIDLQIKKTILYENIQFDYFIAALGSYGTKILNFESDIDLIFITSHSNKKISEKFFVGFLEKLRKELFPLNIDVRLRPEGEGSPLVWELDGYKIYYQKRARVWEFQSLTKIRFIKGNKQLYNELIYVIEKRLENLTEKELITELLSMYKKVIEENRSKLKNIVNIKRGRGTLITIEFLIQYLILKENLFSEIIDKNTIAKFEKLVNKLTDKKDILMNLLDNYQFLISLELCLQNIFNQRSSLLTMDGEKLTAIAKFLNYDEDVELINKIRRTIEVNNEIFNKYLSI